MGGGSNPVSSAGASKPSGTAAASSSSKPSSSSASAPISASERIKKEKQRELMLNQIKKLEDVLNTTREEIAGPPGETSMEELKKREAEVLFTIDRLRRNRNGLEQQLASAPAPSSTPAKSTAAPPPPAKKPSTSASPAGQRSSPQQSHARPGSPATTTSKPPPSASVVASTASNSRVAVPPKDSLTVSSSAADTVTGSGAGDTGTVLGKRKLQDLVAQIDPHQRVDAEVHEFLMELADEFIESTTSFACNLARHRKGHTLEVRDLQLYLESHYQLRIPGFFSTTNESMDIAVARRKPVAVHAHQARVAAVKKAIFDETNRREKSREQIKEKDIGGTS